MRSNQSKFLIWKLVGLAVFTAFLVRFFVLGIYKVPTSSMLPNLYVGDVIYAWKFPFKSGAREFLDLFGGRSSELSRGDMVVFKHPKSGSFYIKRVVGLPGDRIQINSDGIVLNNRNFQYSKSAQLEDYQGHIYYNTFLESLDAYQVKILRRKEKDNQNKESIDMVVPIKSYFVLGDNRDSSDDSRDWGVVPEENIEGLAKKILLSFDWRSQDSNTIRWDRFWLKIE